MRKLLIFSYLIVFLFGLLGIIFFSTIIHEYQHMRDFRNTNITLEDEKIVINVPLKWKNIMDTEGVYSIKIKLSEYDSAQEQTKYTEFKAYTFSIILICIFTLCFIYISYKMESYRTFRYFE